MKRLLVLSLTLAGALSSAQAQVVVQPPESLVVEGQVLWISTRMMIVGPSNDFAVNVDLAKIPQADVRKINLSDYVIVNGYLLRPTRTLLATSIVVVSPWYPQAPQSP